VLVAAKRTKKPKLDDKPKTGRPSIYTPELGEEICHRLAEGESVLRMCKEARMPFQNTVRKWSRGFGIPEEHKATFMLNYEQARLDWQDKIHEELETMPSETETADMSRATLWSNNMKWSLARSNRQRFGDRSELGIAGVEGGVPVTTSNVSVNLANLGPKDQAKLRELARQSITKEEN
jgi:hypothetical protein